MDISSVTNSAPASSSPSSVSGAEGMGKEDFLKLLVTQLENQDPLNPMDNSEFVAQLAQFSTLEGITNLNTSMEDMVSATNSMERYSTSNLVGRLVKFDGSEFEYSGTPVSFGYKLDGDAASVKVSVYDKKGRFVNSMDMGASSKGEYMVNWDGTDNAGAQAASGKYNFTITALDSTGNAVDASRFLAGQVSGVSLSEDDAGLLVLGNTITMDKVREIY